MSRSRILIAAFGDAGHAFPAIALARELDARGHQVRIETWERWREPVEALGIRFEGAEAYEVFPPPPPGERPSAAEAALAMGPLLKEFEPELVVSDILTLAPSLAAELAGCKRATLIPHLYPVHEPGLPFFATGFGLPRTAIGRLAWQVALPVLEAGLRQGRAELNELRARIGLGPLQRFHGGISEELVLVGTAPQLEYPRSWPSQVHTCGPLHFELPQAEVELPPGTAPLVVVAPSTAHDPEGRLIAASFKALADLDVRVIASYNRRVPAGAVEVPANARLHDWLPYSQVMAAADLVICHGGHGTVCRALAHGKPLLVCPALGDMAENALRVQWAGAGLALPGALRRPTPIRSLVRELLSEPSYAARAAEIGEWISANDGAERAAAKIEVQLAAG